MLITKNITSLLLVALIATAMPVQAGTWENIQALLSRMQNNVIARQFTVKRVAAAVAVGTVAYLLWQLKNRQVVVNPIPQQEPKIQKLKEKRAITIPWGVAEYQDGNERHYDIKTGSRFDIFLVCEGYRTSNTQDERTLFSDILVKGYTSGYGRSYDIPPLIESIENEINKGSPVQKALFTSFSNTERLLLTILGHKNDVAAVATVAVVDKETKEISFATLGDIKTAIVGESATHGSFVHDEAKKNASPYPHQLYLPVRRSFGEFKVKSEAPHYGVTGLPKISTLRADDANKYHYMVIASNNLWNAINPQELPQVMQQRLSKQQKNELRANLCSKERCALNPTHGSNETIQLYAGNIRDAALYRAVKKDGSIKDITAMVIDISSLYE